MDVQGALYRYFDAEDVLLYVGISGELATRESAHIRRSQWMQFATRSTIERYALEDVGGAERAAIEAEHPVFNIHYNYGPDAIERLRAYLERVGRLDLMPTRFKMALGADLHGPNVTEEGDLLGLLHAILTANTPDHAGVRLRALAALEGYAELPGGRKLEHLAQLANVNRVTAYRAKKSA